MLSPNPWNGNPEGRAGVSTAEVEAFMNEPTVVNTTVAHWPDPPAKEAFHGLAGEFVERIAPYTEADSIALLGQFLAFFGNAAGRSSHFKVEADLHTANINVILVGDTASGRKGTSLGQVRRPFALVDPAWEDKCIQSGLSSGEGLIWAVRDPIQRKEPIKERGRVVDYQEVIVEHGVDDKRLLDIEAEFSNTLKVADRQGNTLTGIIRQAWDTGNLRLITKTNPAKATDAHISIVGHIPQDELLRTMNTTELGNGFANRFLWVSVRRSKLLPDGGQVPDSDMRSVVDGLKEALEHARRGGELRRDPAARRGWHEVYEELSSRKPGLLGAVLSRAEAQVTRLSLIYALLDKSPAAAVQTEHLHAALAFWEYSEASVRHVFGDAVGDPVADTILTALRANPEGLSRTDVNELFSGHRDRQDISLSLAALARQGLVRSATQETGGRPVEKWIAVRLDGSRGTYSAYSAFSAGPAPERSC